MGGRRAGQREASVRTEMQGRPTALPFLKLGGELMRPSSRTWDTSVSRRLSPSARLPLPLMYA